MHQDSGQFRPGPTVRKQRWSPPNYGGMCSGWRKCLHTRQPESKLNAMKLPEFTSEKTIVSACTTVPSMEPMDRGQSKRKSTLASISVSKSSDPRLSASLNRKENNEQAEIHPDLDWRGRRNVDDSLDVTARKLCVLVRSGYIL